MYIYIYIYIHIHTSYTGVGRGAGQDGLHAAEAAPGRDLRRGGQGREYYCVLLALLFIDVSIVVY